MPMYRNPKFAYVEPRGGGGGLIAAVAAAVLVVGAGGAAVTWLVREFRAIEVDLAIAAGVFVAVMAAAATWMGVHYRRRKLVLYYRPLEVDAAAKARAVTAAETRIDNRQVTVNNDNRQVTVNNDNRQVVVNIHQLPAAEPTPAIAARKVVPGVVLGAAAAKAITPRRAPLYRMNASEYSATDESK